jgi:RNA polymerase sigma factor (sigma-70 family)
MAEAPSDQDLLARWRDGDAESGQALFQRHFDGIYGFFETKCHADADELTQATFLACLRGRDQFRGDSSFRTYLFAIARNELYRLRANERLDFQLSSIMDLVSTPGTKIARNQEHQQLLAALQRLPLEQQTLLELHYWEDMGIGDLAIIFDAPEATIRTRLHRARKLLREKIQQTAPPEVIETLDTMDHWARGLAARRTP